MVKQQTKVEYGLVKYESDDGLWTVTRTVKADHAKCFDRIGGVELVNQLITADAARGIRSKPEGQ